MIALFVIAALAAIAVLIAWKLTRREQPIPRLVVLFVVGIVVLAGLGVLFTARSHCCASLSSPFPSSHASPPAPSRGRPPSRPTPPASCWGPGPASYTGSAAWRERVLQYVLILGG